MICEAFPLHLIPVCLNSPFPILTKQLSKILFHFFKGFQTLNVVKLCSVRNGSSVSTAVNLRGEGTSVAVLHFHFMKACYYCIPQTPGKSGRFLIFPNDYKRQSKVLFSSFTTRPSISSLFFYFH